MSKELKIRTSLNTLLNETITSGGNLVPFYDIVRDDEEKAHIYVAKIISSYMGTKSKDIYQVSLMLGIRDIFNSTYEGHKIVDEIGEAMETILKPSLVITDWQTAVQYLEKTYYAESSNKSRKEVIKMYIYNLIIQDNG